MQTDYGAFGKLKQTKIMFKVDQSPKNVFRATKSRKATKTVLILCSILFSFYVFKGNKQVVELAKKK